MPPTGRYMLWHVMGANPQAPEILQSHRRDAIICPHAVLPPMPPKPAIGDGISWTTPCKRSRSRSAAWSQPKSRDWASARVGRGKSPPNSSSIHQVESIGAIATIHNCKDTPLWLQRRGCLTLVVRQPLFWWYILIFYDARIVTLTSLEQSSSMHMPHVNSISELRLLSNSMMGVRSDTLKLFPAHTWIRSFDKSSCLIWIELRIMSIASFKVAPLEV